MPIQIKDLTGLSKPITRLIEVISQGVGAVSRPYLIRKNADAKAYEVRAIAAALKDVADQHHLPVVFKDGEIDVWQKPDDGTLVLSHEPSEERSNRRSEYERRKRQHNVESITAAAAEELAGENEVSDQPPDEDWVSRFFRAAEDVSSEQMQRLWGRILAGEILRSGSYSLKTLDFVRNLTKNDATMLEHLAKLAVRYQGSAFVPCQNQAWLDKERQIYQGHHFAAGELGAMYPTELAYRLFRDPNTKEEAFTSGKLILIVDRGELSSEVSLPVWKFTTVGQEMLQLIPTDGDLEQMTEVGRFFERSKAKAKVADILERLSTGQIRYVNAREVASSDTQV